MTMQYKWILLGIAAGLAGCSANSPAKLNNHYSTVVQDIGRDTDRARHENAQGIDWLNQGEWDKAEQAFKSALEADVTFGPAHNNLGNVYCHQSKYYLAAWEFQYAIKLMPYSVEPHNNLGLVLEAVGKLDEAVKNYDEALALQPANPEVIGNDARARLRRGDNDSDVNQLLSKVVMDDTRLEWSDWAREMLVLRKAMPPPTTSPALLTNPK